MSSIKSPQSGAEAYAGLNISVIGSARSGIDAARVLSELGAKVLLSDGKAKERLEQSILAQIQDLNIDFKSALTPCDAIPEGTDLVVTSPGVPSNSEVLKYALAAGIPVWSEIELAYRIAPCRIIAVTGTNGKTTTALLTAHILNCGGMDAVAAGNISADELKRTLVDAAYDARQRRSSDTILVAEISSFQLEWVDKFAPWISILTNITPDHLNRHESFDEYASAKARIFAAQTAEDWSILNCDDNESHNIATSVGAGQRVWISTVSGAPPPSAYLKDGVLTVAFADGKTFEIMAASEMPETLPGVHNIYNALAASTAAVIAGVPRETIATAIQSFAGVAHRMEYVATINDVRFINNSMCTNVAASIASLEAVGRPAILIAGGADKEMDFSPLAEPLLRLARQVFLIGSAADKMQAAFEAGGYTAITRCNTLEQAVRSAAELARPGEAVMLSPGCASFDMFRDFEARGAAFRAAVHNLTGGGTK